MTDHPAGEPRTEAGRVLLGRYEDADAPVYPPSVADILAIEREAAAPAEPPRPEETYLPPRAPDDVRLWMESNHLVAISRGAYDDIRLGRFNRSAAPSGQPLDVERLARAFTLVQPALYGESWPNDDPDDFQFLNPRQHAERIAAEYARLAELSEHPERSE